MINDTTIAAIATPAGVGAIAIIRLSGKQAISICEKVFQPKKKGIILSQQKPYTIHFGSIVEGKKAIDEVLVSLFKSPHSYTGEDTVEISCHGSIVIQQEILELLIRNGAVHAQPGEFTLRAFLNGKMDLSQAEGVADLIAANSEASRRVAMDQMRGGFSTELKLLRDKLLHFISLIELELDFSEEDVEFADRSQLKELINSMLDQTTKLMESFKFGNVIKQGVPVAIVGKPNVGKSTLLNRILNEEKAIVSEIAGTTRDSIEDTISIKGVNFRFIDTAGLRHTTDTIESIGIERAYQKIAKARIVLVMLDAKDPIEELVNQIENIAKSATNNQQLIALLNKADMVDKERIEQVKQTLKIQYPKIDSVEISAKHNQNIDRLTEMLAVSIIPATDNVNTVIVTNARHYESLYNAKESLERAINALDRNIPTDLLAMDIRQVLHYIGEITGQITTDEILGSIFSKFCIGK